MARQGPDLSGKRFARLLLLHKTRKGKAIAYACLCDCGKHTTVRRSHLVQGLIKSCGCFQKDQVRARFLPKAELTLPNNVLSYYTRNAKKRGILWLLQPEEFIRLVKAPCYYCGRTGVTKISNSLSQFSYTGVDRINNELGYTHSNSVPCCKTCNIAKGSMTFDEFREWATTLSHNLENHR